MIPLGTEPYRQTVERITSNHVAACRIQREGEDVNRLDLLTKNAKGSIQTVLSMKLRVSPAARPGFFLSGSENRY
jgi:hypothetical protein